MRYSPRDSWGDEARRTHDDRDLLDDRVAGVLSLPGFPTPAHNFKEGKQRRDAKSRDDDREGSSGGVPSVFVCTVDIRSHGGDVPLAVYMSVYTFVYLRSGPMS